MKHVAKRVGAIDLGSESGRVTAVDFDGERLRLTVAHRFATSTTSTSGLRWDLGTLTNDMFAGMAKLGREGTPIESVGVDSWGVDYVLLDSDGHTVDEPFTYRDPRNAGAFELAVAEFGAANFYEHTGTQLIPINTVFGLLDDLRNNPARLAGASSMLMIADYAHYLLSGALVSERTLASTTGLLDPRSRAWADGLIDKLGLPRGLFSELVDPGTVLGPILDFDLPGWSKAAVVTPGSHDTASAVLAVPFRNGDSTSSAFISSGSWSLIGREQTDPVVTDAARTEELTNEVGFGAQTLVLRNVAGLWLLQACKRQWEREGLSLGYDQIANLAAAERPLVSLIDPDSAEFVEPGDMPTRIREYCARSGQPVPYTVGQVARTIIDSLALRYRRTLDSISQVSGAQIDAIHVVGGGSRHMALAQATADATRVPVHCGPVEATALGNAGGQLIALGELSGPSDLRSVVAASEAVAVIEPGHRNAWDDVGETFLDIVANHSRRIGTLQ